MKTVYPRLLTVALLAIIFFLAMRGTQDARDEDLAKELLGSASPQQIELSDAADPPAFRAGLRVALFFEKEGMQGPIRGVMVLQNDRIVDLRILESREGIGADPLDTPGFLQSFFGQPAKSPLTVDGVSGATITSQAVIDAVNARLAQWEAFSQRESARARR